MSVLPNTTMFNTKEYVFVLVNSQKITTSTINANTGFFSTITAQDGQFSSITGVGSFSGSNISSLTGYISSLTTNYISSQQAYISSLTTDFISSPKGYISSLTVNDIKGDRAFFSTLAFSTLNIQTLNVSNISSLTGNIGSLTTIFLASSNISNSNEVRTKFLVATSSASAPNISGTNVTGTNGNFTNLDCTKFTSANMSNTGTFYNDGAVYFDDTLNVSGNASVIGNITSSATVSGDILNGLYGNVYNTLRVAPVFPVGPDIGTILSPSTITTDHLFVRSNVSTNTLLLYGTSNTQAGIGFTTETGELSAGIGLDALSNFGVGSLGNLNLFSVADTTIQSSNMTVIVGGDYTMLSIGNIIAGSLNDVTFGASTLIMNADVVGISSVLAVGGTALTTDIINSCNITTDTLTANVVTFSNINVTDANITGTLTVGGATTLNGNVTINNTVSQNGDIDFGFLTLSTIDPAFFPPYTQWQYNMNNVNAVNCGSITVVGGATGFTDVFNDYTIPFHYPSYVTVGNTDRDLLGGVTCQSIVVLNGQAPDILNPGTNLTTALTVYGDVEVGAVDPLDWGTLTSYNGTRLEGINPEGLALEVAGDVVIVAPVLVDITSTVDITLTAVTTTITGIVTCVGAVGVGGALGVIGVTDATGIINANGGVAVLGLFTQSGGDFTVGDNTHSATINAPLTVNETTSFNNVVTMNDTLDMANNPIINVGGISGSNIGFSNGFFTNISTNTISIYTLGGTNGISFSDASNIVTAGISVDTANNNELGIASISSLSLLSFEGGININSKLSLNLGSGEGPLAINAFQDAITIQADQAITLTSADAGIALAGSNGVFTQDQYGASFNVAIGSITGTTGAGGSISLNSGNVLNLTASSNVLFGNGNLSNINSIYVASNVDAPILNSIILLSCNALVQQAQINRLAVSTINTTGGNITVDANIEMPTSILYAGGVVSPAIYTTDLYPTPTTSLISVRAPIFDFTNNNITSVNSASVNVLNANILSNLNPTIQVAVNMDFTNKDIYNINNITASNLSLISGLTTSNIVASNITTPAISTINISTGTLNANFITAPVNVNFGKNVIPSGNLDLGASGAFRWNNLWVSTVSSIHLQTSTITVQNNIRASTIEVNRITGTNGGANTYTGNLFPFAGSAFIGYGQTIASGGFYAQGTFRSTITQVIAPEIGAGIYSNIVRIQGNTLCQNINVSSIFTSTISTNILTTQFILGAGPIAGTSVYTNTLLPNGSSGIGNTGNNFYTQGCFNSTFTQVIQPRTDASVSALNSNVIRINGFISTQSLGVSTINFKAYPFVSTLNNPIATATPSVVGIPVLTRIQSNTLSFPRAGTYKVFQEYAITKETGGANQGIHGSLIYACNGATTATISNAVNWPNMGMSACPFQDKSGYSTFTTAVTSILVNSGNLTRDLYYYDSGTGTYSAGLYVAPPQISYIPSVGIAPEV